MPQKTKRDLPLAVMKRIMRRAGATRVSADAVNALALQIENIASRVVPLAVKNAEHGKRTTLRKDDIELAFSHWQGGQ